MNEIVEQDVFNCVSVAPQVLPVKEQVIKEEDLPIDMDYIAIMMPSSKIVREYFKEIAEELNQLVWK